MLDSMNQDSERSKVIDTLQTYLTCVLKGMKVKLELIHAKVNSGVCECWSMCTIVLFLYTKVSPQVGVECGIHVLHNMELIFQMDAEQLCSVSRC